MISLVPVFQPLRSVWSLEVNASHQHSKDNIHNNLEKECMRKPVINCVYKIDCPIWTVSDSITTIN